MAIRSDSFGRVTLTGAEAEKFRSQVVHGRPKAAAKETAKEGLKLIRQFQKKGKLHLKVVMP
jgi:hypothetical protein